MSNEEKNKEEITPEQWEEFVANCWEYEYMEGGEKDDKENRDNG